MQQKNFALEDYDYEKYEWYNPVFVIQCYNDLMTRYPGTENHSLFKEAKEALSGAIALLGARSLHPDNTYLMQMNRQFKRPDVIAATRRVYIDGKPIIKISPLEITEMESHTDHDDIAKFLSEKKLADDYPPEIIFICVINKKLNFNIFEIAKKIKSTGKRNAIYILGMKTDTTPFKLNIASPQPIIAVNDFTLIEQGTNYPEKHRMFLVKDETNLDSTPKPISVKPIDLFEFFKLDGETIERVFGPLKF